MKTHTSSFKEQIKLIGKEIDSRITFGDTVLGKDDLNAVTPSYQGAILKSVMKQLDIDSNVEIPIGTILKYEFGLKVNGEYEYINYGNYIVYSIEKQEDTNSYKIVCYDKLLYSMLDYVKLPITYPISIRDYINAISTALGLKFANKSETFANYNKQIQADLYDGLGYTFRDVLDELAQVTASTICLNNNDELEIRYITETGDTIDEEFLKDVNVNFGEKFGAVNTIVLSRSGDSDSVYYPPTLPANPYEIKISDNQIMNGNDRVDFLPDIYNKLNGLEFYTNDFVSTGICYYDLCDRYSVKVGDNTYSCVMFNDEVLVTQGLEENIYTELPEQTETDYKHASKDDRMINQVYIIAKKNEAEILALVSTTETIQKEINPTKDESGSEIIIEDGSNNPLIDLEIEGKSTQETRSGKNLFKTNEDIWTSGIPTYNEIDDTFTFHRDSGVDYLISYGNLNLKANTDYVMYLDIIENTMTNTFSMINYNAFLFGETAIIGAGETGIKTFSLKTKDASTVYDLWFYCNSTGYLKAKIMLIEGTTIDKYEPYGVMPSPDYPSEIKSVGYENLFNPNNLTNNVYVNIGGSAATNNNFWLSGYIEVKANAQYALSNVASGIIYYDSNKTYIAMDTDTKNFTTRNLTKFVRINYAKGSVTYENANTVMMNKGDKLCNYILYGKYGIEVKTVGKNLLDINNIRYEYCTKNNDGSFTANINNYYFAVFYGTDELINLFLNSLGKTFTFSVENNYNYQISIVVEGTRSNGLTYQEATKTGNYVTIKIADNFTSISSIQFRVLRNSTKFTDTTSIIKNLQLEESATVTEYQPYQKRISVIELNAPLRSLPNGVKDIAYIKNNKLYVERYVGSVVLDGSESFYLNAESDFALAGTNYKRLNDGGLCISSHYPYSIGGQYDNFLRIGNAIFLMIKDTRFTTVADFKTWLSTHNTEVIYELATPVTEELGEIEMLSTFKGYNEITTTDNLLPIINLTYVRDTIIADYVENHVTELKITENEIKASVESVSSSVDGLNTTVNRVEEITTDNSQVINVISTNIDQTTGEVREVTTTTGFTFNDEGMTIDDGSGFRAQHRAGGTYYKDGESIVGQYTKDGSKQKDLELFGTYSYGKESIDDTPMFVGQLYTDENGEQGFGHFYNGEG